MGLLLLPQEMIGQHAGLYELLRVCSHGDFMHSYQASAILRRYGGSSLEAGLHLQRLLAVISCCQDLKSGMKAAVGAGIPLPYAQKGNEAHLDQADTAFQANGKMQVHRMPFSTL